MLFLEALQGKYTQEYYGREQELLGDMDKIMEEYKEYIEVLKIWHVPCVREQCFTCRY